MTTDSIILFVLQCDHATAVSTMSTRHVSVRLGTETIARVDALATRFSSPYRPATRSDVLRALILTALAALAALADREEEAGRAGHFVERGPGEGPRGKSKLDPP